MKFNQQLREGKFIRRYKRFFADIEFEGETIVAHVPNTGSMKGCKEPGSPCLFSTNDDPKRKLKYTLEMVKPGGSWVGLNTGLPNKLVLELFSQNPLPHWQPYNRVQGEVKISDKSRIDLVLWNSTDHDVEKWKPLSIKKPMHLIEVKNVTMAEAESALFPDAVTTRGQKHIDELVHLKKKGFSSELVFVVQRRDCKVFRPADDIDADYGKKLRDAVKKGVKVTALLAQLDKNEVKLDGTSLEIEL